MRIKKNCKRIIIRIINGEVVVTAPPYVKKKTIDSFVESKDDWIESNLAVDKRKFTAVKDLTSIYLFGIKHAVHFINSGRKTIGIKKEDAFIVIDTPLTTEDEKIIAALKNQPKQADWACPLAHPFGSPTRPPPRWPSASPPQRLATKTPPMQH